MTKASQEVWAIRISNLEALKHLTEGDAEMEAELTAMQKIAFAAMQEASQEAK